MYSPPDSLTMRTTMIMIRDRMRTVWQGIHRLEASATLSYGPTIPPTRYQAWWQAPDQWRHDVTPHDQLTISYRAHGDAWWVLRNGILWNQGTIEEARRSHLTAHELLEYGRPYLTPQANAHLWLWLNPPIWAYSFNLVLNVGYTPGVMDDFAPDAPIVHLVAASSWDPHVGADAPSETIRYWWATAWDREQELTDYANCFQLWVDRRTGFCRRMTAEGTDGRFWDLVIDEPVINGTVLDPAIFRGES